MKIKSIHYFLSILLPIVCFSQEDFQKILFLENKVEIKVPIELKEMDDLIFQQKYHTKIRPSLVLSDKTTEINLLSNVTYIPSNENKIESFKDYQITNLSKKRKDIKILETGVKKVDDKNVAYCKFQSEEFERKIFNYYFFILFEKNILMFSFNCNGKIRSEWKNKI